MARDSSAPSRSPTACPNRRPQRYPRLWIGRLASTMTTPTKPIDIYVRVSRVGGRKNLMSPEDQEREARAYARSHGLKIGIVLPPDLDESGAKWERPGLQEALRRVRAGKSGGILIADLDRLTRDVGHGQRLVNELQAAGARFYAPNAPEDVTTPEGELQVGITFLFAQYERKKKQAGFERAKKAAIEAGIPVITRPAVGLRQREDRRLEPDPDVAPTVREVFERRAAGEGPTSIARFLESRGIETSQGSKFWTKQAVMNLIHNRVYLGELSYGKDRRYVNPTALKPIVDLDIWQAAQHPTGHGLKPTVSGDYLVTGILRCAACGYSVNGTRSSHGTRVYRCARKHSGGDCPRPGRVNADAVEAVVERAYFDVFGNLRAVIPGAEADTTKLEEQLERAERRLRQAMSPEVQDAAGERWAEMIKQRRQERDQSARALGEAKAAQTRPALPTNLPAIWHAMKTVDRRDMLMELFDTLAIRRDDSGVTLIAFLKGNGPTGLSRRGFRKSPGLHPIEATESAWVIPVTSDVPERDPLADMKAALKEWEAKADAERQLILARA